MDLDLDYICWKNFHLDAEGNKLITGILEEITTMDINPFYIEKSGKTYAVRCSHDDCIRIDPHSDYCDGVKPKDTAKDLVFRLNDLYRRSRRGQKVEFTTCYNNRHGMYDVVCLNDHLISTVNCYSFSYVRANNLIKRLDAVFSDEAKCIVDKVRKVPIHDV